MSSRRVTLGGERLGGGKKNKVAMHGFSRSNHDLSHVVRTTMSAGTLVPFMNLIGLPGDSFDINLDVDVMTLPTLGPLLGSFKIHLDVFWAPTRLYQAELHMNKLAIGMNMSNVLLPQYEVDGNIPDATKPMDNQQVHPAALIKYLGVSGLGYKATSPLKRRFDATPLLAYWDIYKQYYANKQEANGAMIHNNPQPVLPTISGCAMQTAIPTGAIAIAPAAIVNVNYQLNDQSNIVVTFTGGTLTASMQPNQLIFDLSGEPFPTISGAVLCKQWTVDVANNRMIGSNFYKQNLIIGRIAVTNNAANVNLTPQIYRFPLANIDAMRANILAFPGGNPYVIPTAWPSGAPYSSHQHKHVTAAGPPEVANYAAMFTQEGLGLRTYASDLFNNWLETGIIDGGTGITEVTKVNVVGNKFTIDELNLQKKVYEMLNRIAISGGTYDDWLDASYDHMRTRATESPVYLGGKLANLVFQEVTSTAAAGTNPLGTLAGKGRMGSIKKGGKITVKCDEPGRIIGIVSLVPNIDYSQGNEWSSQLKTMNDYHKPGLDEIGFQNLVTDQMAWFDSTQFSVSGVTYRTAGKQPAWINYMTMVNKVYGAFADQNDQMFMVLNRRYTATLTGGTTRIDDLTTYIDPTKYNHIFADTRLDAMNFWVQIGMRIEARRKMSAKVIPNL